MVYNLLKVLPAEDPFRVPAAKNFITYCKSHT